MLEELFIIAAKFIGKTLLVMIAAVNLVYRVGVLIDWQESMAPVFIGVITLTGLAGLVLVTSSSREARRAGRILSTSFCCMIATLVFTILGGMEDSSHLVAKLFLFAVVLVTLPILLKVIKNPDAFEPKPSQMTA